MAPTTLAFVLYPGFTALDLIGPCEVIGRWPGAESHFVASRAGTLHTDLGLPMEPTVTIEALRDVDLVVVPGASDPLAVLGDAALIAWLADVAPRAQWTASVCTGAALYAKAGLLDGRPTTTHWAFRDNLRAMGAKVVNERVVWDGTHISGAGVSAGIDMALALTARVHGERLAKTIQLGIEYDPQPPFAEGSVDTAGASTLRHAFRMMLGDRPVNTALRFASHLARARAGRG